MKKRILTGIMLISLLMAVTIMASPGAPSIHTWNLKAGWNLVSTPVIPIDPKASTILADIPFYQFIEWTGYGYSNADKFVVGHGYWILVLEPVSVDVVGEIPNQVNVTLSAPWNMIGGPNTAVEQPDAFRHLLTWNGTQYIFADVLEPGVGYWAYSDSDPPVEVPLG